MQIVDVLRAEKKAAGELGFELGEGNVRGVGRDFCAVAAALGIEIPDQRRVAPQSFWGTDFFDVVSGPQTVGRTEGGQAALGADACASEDEEAVGWSDGDGHDRESWFVIRDSRLAFGI